VEVAPSRFESDRELAAAMSSRNEDAIGELYDRYGRLAYSIAMQMLGDPGRAEECVQDAFMRVWRASSTFDPALGTLRSWLVATVRNRAIDIMRAQRRDLTRELELGFELSDDSANPESEASSSFERRAVRAAIAHLPQEQRKTLELSYFGGFTQTEIGKIMDVPLGTVKSRTRLALEKVSSYLRATGVIDV
jgi:RNA polymerase sigma-70 factor (ECF subfamily)